jgi:pimeloyl-ACP methyl ester carboxylesterase
MNEFETGLFLNRIPYVKAGCGEKPIVVFNGGQAFVRRPAPDRTRRDARRIARLLPADQPFYVFGYDPAPPDNYSIDVIVRDFAEILRTKIGPATVMGISFGGFVAARLAADHPDLARELILMVSAHRFSPEGRRSIARQIACAERGDFAGLLAEFGMVFRRPWFNWLLRLRFWLERNRMAARMNDPGVIVRGLSAVAADDFGADPSWLRRIEAPTLIVGATRDTFFDRSVLEEAVRLIPRVRLALFEDETHMLPVERSRDVAQAVSAFLAQR